MIHKYYLFHPVMFLARHHLRHVILHVTDRCNLRCRTCFVRKQTHDMALADAKAIASKLGKVRWLDIGGGEPFLHPELTAICGLFPGSEITIPTNGQMPEHIHRTVLELASAFKNRLTLAVSLDGFEATNDSLRGEGSYGKALRTLELLRAVPCITVKVNTVVCAANFSELTSFMRFVRGLAPDYHSLLLLRGAPEDSALALPPLDALEAATEEVLNILGSYDYGDKGNPLLRVLKKRYQRYLWLLNLKTLRTQQCWVPCKAPCLHRAVYPDGAVSLCELMPPVGNLLEEPMDLLEEKMIDTLARYERSHGPCFCTHNCNLGENIQTHFRSILSVLLGMDP
ncbi:MAG: radical SAM protein [Candidatus Hydrogenedentes bacterium]|jgi:MoaA/NifB/PqqE/SkfB family radical SAM enzyme|nr:radical SAM protein [Candidatus Hydrogenedentota bacterium]